MRPCLLMLLVLLHGGPAAADPSRAAFDFRVGGVRAGTLTLAGEERSGRYAVSGLAESAGIVGALRDVRYEASVRGRFRGSAFAPKAYAETFRGGAGERKDKSIVYSGGVPSLRTDDGRRDADDLDPATQGGTVDPLTAIWGILRDVPEAQACRFSATMFDGTRRSSIALAPAGRGADEIACTGEYRRIAGYDDDDMARRTRFGFQVVYAPAGGGRWQVERVDMDTRFGRGSLMRR